MRAVLSVSDKTGLADFARGLAILRWELYATGQTQQALADAGVPATSVGELTAFPEILDGRVKTLHPALHAGILARRDVPAHLADLEARGIGAIDLVVSNLYPFVETVADAAAPFGALAPGDSALPQAVQTVLEQIDIGGPTLVRAAAKNFEHVVAVTDPADYQPVLEALRAGGVSLAMRAQLAQKAFAHTAHYDAYVAQYMAAINGVGFADAVSLPLVKALPLTYGENPHQQAALYRLGDTRLAGPSLADLEQLGGAALSYNNLLDLDNAYAIVAEFDEPAVAIVKHNNPCGAGTASTLVEAYRKAQQGDPLSAWGGVVAANRPVDPATAHATRGTPYMVVVAPGYDGEALHVFRRLKKPPTRVVQLPLPPRASSEDTLPGFRLHYRPVRGGFLAQTRDAVSISNVTFHTVTRRAPTEKELGDIRFAWRVVKHVRSNASVFARASALVAAGAGQMSRVDSVIVATHIAARSAQLAGGEDAPHPAQAARRRPAEGCVMATDGFFLKTDAVEAAAEAGVTAVVHPGGGQHDEAAAAAADRYHLAMVTTGYRHFRH